MFKEELIYSPVFSGSHCIPFEVNALLHNSFSNRIYPGTTKILLTINLNTRLKSRELSTPLPMGVISLAISVNTDTSN